MIVPAYTDVNGTYPKEKNEIMLSRETLDQMKIDDPEIGMRIQMKTILADGTEETVTFLLSGYYTDYLDTSVTGPHAYISEQFLKEHDIPVFPADKLWQSPVRQKMERGWKQNSIPVWTWSTIRSRYLGKIQW